MKLKILCSGYLVRYPLGGMSWHHLQYLIGLQRLGHEVIFFEDYGWANACYDPLRNTMTADPCYGLAYLVDLLRPYGLEGRWCYLAEDGTAYGMSRQRLTEHCRDCDLYLNLSNVNWIPELEHCKRRVLVDTDPVFTQIGAHGMTDIFTWHHTLFTYGENVHQQGCTMPTGGACWQPTRQPVVLDLWPVQPGCRTAPFTTVMNWSSLSETEYEGTIYGGKDREFSRFVSLPSRTSEPMEIALNSAPDIQQYVAGHGWRLVPPARASHDPWHFQQYLQASRAEFSIAKHGYVTTQCGWFSDRSAAYLASGRPVVVQETGFSSWLETGTGILPFHTLDEALVGIEDISQHYSTHCKAAREIAEAYFSAPKVLSHLLDRALEVPRSPVPHEPISSALV